MMNDYEENGYIEAYLIIEEAHGEVIMAPIEWGNDITPRLRAEEILFHARDYVEEQIPQYLRGTY